MMASFFGVLRLALPPLQRYARVTRFSASRLGTSRADTPSRSPDVVTTPHPRVRTLQGRGAPGTFLGGGAPGNISACSVELALREMGAPSLAGRAAAGGLCYSSGCRPSGKRPLLLLRKSWAALVALAVIGGALAVLGATAGHASASRHLVTPMVSIGHNWTIEGAVDPTTQVGPLRACQTRLTPMRSASSMGPCEPAARVDSSRSMMALGQGSRSSSTSRATGSARCSYHSSFADRHRRNCPKATPT